MNAAISEYLQYVRKSSIRMLYEDEHLRIYRKMKTKDKFLHYVDTNDTISAILKFLHIRDNQEAKKDIRTIYINNVKPKFYSEVVDVPLKYKSNSIKTSKYTIINFLPKNLFEQFRRIVNLYYLINIILMFLIPDPPTSPSANLIPIIFVIGVTAIKQGYEDILRHKSDREINNLPTRILRNGKFETHSWKSIKVGDIVEVLSDEQIPCDLLLLHSNAENSVCCVTTANLDGESNLKIRSVPAKFPPISTPEEFAKLRAVIKCDKPNGDFYEFKGKMVVNNQEYPIINDNILLRGCRVKISPAIYGVAIYTGQDTKMMINSKFKSNKISCIERRANLFIGIFLIILAILTFGCFFGTLGYSEIYNTHWYLWGSELAFYYSNRTLYNLCNLILYMNLFNYIIPLSMYVTVELQRFVGSQFIEWDLKLYDEKNDQPAKANSSDLNEDLGQVEYLFSDKTGTLTENFMEFKQFSINGEKFEERDGKLFKIGVEKEIFVFQNELLVRFFQIMTLCHTVHVEEENEEKYQASSPDEFSFVKFCARLGVEFVGDEKDENSPYMIRVVKYKNEIYKYQILNILEFDSDRKRMSVIVKDLLENRILLLSKGAETSIFKKCTSDLNSQLIQTCDADIHMFAHQGWRTLALAFKYLSEQEYNQIDEMIKESYNDILHRKEMLAKCYEEVEDGLELLGATAVEDKLQEDVSDTLEKLRKGGIKIWVLTGDKRETAINISNSCKHFSDSMIKLMLTDIKQPEHIKSRLEHFIKLMTPTQSYALIVDGMTLKLVFDNKFQAEFKQVCMQCEAVLCCRMTPAQKAQVVRLIKKSKGKPMTAAIGDGANDVSMIQEAHVGLGIYGKEGRNAARSADFAFSKFKFTRRLLLTHGYLYYTRAAVLVHYFFYKNLAFALCQFFFAFSNAFTVTSLYGSLILTLYNVVLTSAPILIFGLFEQRVNIPTLEKNPYLYRVITRNRYLKLVHFVKWNLLAVWHALVVYFFSYAIYAPATSLTQDGKETDSTSFGFLIATQIIVLVHLKLFIEWHYKSRWLIFGFLLSTGGYAIFCLVINAFIIPEFLVSLTDNQNTYYSFFYFFSTGPTWFVMIVAMFTAILPDMIINVIENLQENMLIKKARHEEFKRERKMNKEVSFVNYTDNDNDSRPGGSNQDYDTDASLLKKSSTTNPINPKVRVFYIPTNQNRVSDTKVKEEVMVLSSSSDHDFYNTTNPTSRTQLNPPNKSTTDTSSDSLSGDDKEVKIFPKKKIK